MDFSRQELKLIALWNKLDCLWVICLMIWQLKIWLFIRAGIRQIQGQAIMKISLWICREILFWKIKLNFSLIVCILAFILSLDVKSNWNMLIIRNKLGKRKICLLFWIKMMRSLVKNGFRSLLKFTFRFMGRLRHLLSSC